MEKDIILKIVFKYSRFIKPDSLLYAKLMDVKNYRIEKIRFTNENNQNISISKFDYVANIDENNGLVEFLIDTSNNSDKFTFEYILDEEYEFQYISLFVENMYFSKLIPFDLEKVEFLSVDKSTMLFQNFINGKLINKTVCFLGLSKMFLYNNTLQYKDFLNRISDYIITLINDGYCYFITNGNYGGEEMVFDVIESLKSKYPHIKNILAVSCADFYKNWTNIPIEKADIYLEVDTLSFYNTNFDTIGKMGSYKNLMIKNFDMDFAKKFAFVTSLDNLEYFSQLQQKLDDKKIIYDEIY